MNIKRTNHNRKFLEKMMNHLTIWSNFQNKMNNSK